MSQPSNSLVKPTLLILAAVVVVVSVLVIWNMREASVVESPREDADPFANLDLEQPQPSFLLLQYVAEHGGEEFHQRLAIQWLDDFSRLRSKPRPSQEAWLLGLIDSGGHPAWDIETTLWIFNNTFNVLHHGKEHEKLTLLLNRLATTHPHKTMQNYAVQHIEVQRSYGNLEGKAADEAYSTLLGLAKSKESEAAGAALLALSNWNGDRENPSEELVTLALEIAADTQRSVDVRVTALHSCSEQGLSLARAIAIDTTQSIHMRKAAIGCMGRYGNESDADHLEALAGENFRIAQAAKPALKNILHRQSNPKPRARIEF